ncbi:MAG: P-loop NTPase [Nostocaceae cyanobacterium]|nr:P-loop NTPase [Nostocaceae cyanobacterium]
MNRIFAVAIRHWIALLGLNAVLLAATYQIISKTPKVWNANAEMILPHTTSDLNANLGTLGNLSGGGVVFSQQLNPLKILSAILLSDDTLIAVQKVDPEKELYPSTSTYRGLFDVSPQGETTIISLSANGSSPAIARQRLTNLITVFQNRLDELRVQDAAGRAKLVQKELNQARLKLQQAQKQLAEYKQSANLVSNEDQTQQMVVSINTLTTTLAQVRSEFQASQAQVKMLSQRLGLTPEAAIKSVQLKENRNYQYIRQKLPEVEAELVKLQVVYTNDHPQVIKLLSERDKLRQQMQTYIADASAGVKAINTSVDSDSAVMIQRLVLAESENRALEKRVKQLEVEINQQKEILRSLPAAQSRLQELQRQYNIAEGVYNGLVAKMQEARLNALSTYPSVQTLSQPTVNPRPSSSKSKAILLGGILASVFGSVAVVLFLESRNPLLGLGNLRDVEIPLLGSIPRLKQVVIPLKSGTEGHLEFQRLASSVSMMQLDNHCLMISSAIAHEGKTTVTLGLAYALVSLGFRVLLVDGDFHKAELSRRLGYSHADINGSRFIPIHVAPNLDLVPTIPHGSETMEFVARGRFQQFLQTAQSGNDYDYVLVDSAPITLTSEAALMAHATGNVLLVTWLGVSQSHAFNSSIEQLSRHQANIVGLVNNGTETQKKGYLYTPSKS